MTRQQAKIILCLADNDMNAMQTARDLNYHKNSISYHILKIERQTGKNPRKFYDLCELVQTAREVMKENEPKCKTTNLPCCWCSPGPCEHREE